MTIGLTRMLALKGAQLTPLLSVMYRNVETRKEFGLKEFGEPPHPKGSRARAQQLLPYPCVRRRAKAVFTESQTPFITELHFHLHTNYFKELEKV